LPLDGDSILALAAQSMFHLFSSISQGMFLVDRRGCIVWVNEGYRRFLPALGFSSIDQFLGHRVEDVIHNTQMRRVLETGEPILIDLLTNKAGTFVVSRLPLRDDAGGVIGAIGIVLFDHPETTLKPLISKFARLQQDLDDARRELAVQRKRQLGAPDGERRAKYTFASFVGTSPAAVEVKRQARRAAQSASPVLLLGETGQLSIAPNTYQRLPYDPQKSYEHIAIVAMAPVVLLAKNGLAAGTVQEAAALARQQSAKGGLMYGTFGPGSAPHLAREMYAEAAGAKMLPVPYKGSAQLVTAMIGGEVDLGVDTVSSAAPQVRAGKIRALAVTGERRMPQLPDVPTFAEAGMADVSFVGWYALVAPARTPAPVVDTLSRAVAEIMEDPQVRKSVADLALDPVYLPAPAFKAQITKELRTFSEVAARAGITLD